MKQIELNQILSSTDLNELYTELKSSGYLKEWKFVITVDNKIRQSFKTVDDYYEFHYINNNEYKCIRINENSLEPIKSQYIVGSVDKKSPAYWQQWPGGKKLDWNPVTPIGGTNIKDYRKL